MKNFIVHNLLKLYAYRDWAFFTRNLNNVEQIQKDRLLAIINSLTLTHPNKTVKSIKDFKLLPLTTYQDWKEHIDAGSLFNSKICSSLVRYQPTSGSTDKLKWIPYNKDFLKAINRSANVWMYDLYQLYPNIKKGSHYWSLSWLPNEFRGKVDNDDSALLGQVKQKLLSHIFPVPTSVIHENTLSTSLQMTALYLLMDKKLSLISVWSPTFLFSIFEVIESEKAELETIIKQRFNSNQKLTQRVKDFDRDNINATWPELELISSWDTSTSKLYAEKLKDVFKTSHFQGKGLWATEGVITIPYQGEMLLSYTSHYYEFLNLATEEIIDVSQLSVGDRVMPVITTQNGILRYKMNDELLVSGFNGTCPKLTFIGRIGTVDLVGEKIDHTTAMNIVKELDASFIVAIQQPVKEIAPYYALITKNKSHKSLETLLLLNFHYKLARELGQLSESVVIVVSEPDQLYLQLCNDKGMILGSVKPEILTSIKTDERLTTA